MTDRARLVEEFKHNYRLNRAILREAGTSNQKYDFRSCIKPTDKRAAEEKWGRYDTTKEKQSKIFKAASGGDKSAVDYIWLKSSDAIGRAFWKRYLGPSPNARRRKLEQGAFYDWAAIAYETLTHGNKDYADTKGALETFNPERIQSGDLFKYFELYYWNKLNNSAKESNYNDSASGVTDTPGIKKGVRSAQSGGAALQVGMYDPTYMDSKQESEDYSDPTVDSVIAREEWKEFLSNWKQAVVDPDVTTPKAGGVIPIDILKTVIEAGPEADSFKVLTDKYQQVSRNTLAGYLREVVEILSDYGIRYEDLTRVIRDLGPEGVTKYITAKPSEAAAPVKKTSSDRPKEKSGDLTDKFRGFLKDHGLWTSARKNKTGTWHAGNVAYHMIKDPELTPEDFTEMNRIPGSWNEVTMERVKKMLNRQGIAWSDVTKLSKKKRNELAEMIAGEE